MARNNISRFGPLSAAALTLVGCFGGDDHPTAAPTIPPIELNMTFAPQGPGFSDLAAWGHFKNNTDGLPVQLLLREQTGDTLDRVLKTYRDASDSLIVEVLPGILKPATAYTGSLAATNDTLRVNFTTGKLATQLVGSQSGVEQAGGVSGDLNYSVQITPNDEKIALARLIIGADTIAYGGADTTVTRRLAPGNYDVIGEFVTEGGRFQSDTARATIDASRLAQVHELSPRISGPEINLVGFIEEGTHPASVEVAYGDSTFAIEPDSLGRFAYVLGRVGLGEQNLQVTVRDEFDKTGETVLSRYVIERGMFNLEVENLNEPSQRTAGDRFSYRTNLSLKDNLLPIAEQLGIENAVQEVLNPENYLSDSPYRIDVTVTDQTGTRVYSRPLAQVTEEWVDALGTAEGNVDVRVELYLGDQTNGSSVSVAFEPESRLPTRSDYQAASGATGFIVQGREE